MQNIALDQSQTSTIKFKVFRNHQNYIITYIQTLLIFITKMRWKAINLPNTNWQLLTVLTADPFLYEWWKIFVSLFCLKNVSCVHNDVCFMQWKHIQVYLQLCHCICIIYCRQQIACNIMYCNPNCFCWMYFNWNFNDFTHR